MVYIYHGRHTQQHLIVASQELQLRMRQEALLEDRDFDLQERKRVRIP